MSNRPFIEIEYTLSPESYQAAALAQLDSPSYQSVISRGRRMAAVRTLVLFPLYVLGSIGMFWLIDPAGYSVDDTWRIAILIGIVAGVIAMLFNTSKSRFIEHHRKQLELHAIESSWPGFLGKCTLAIDESGIRYQCRGQDSRYSWTTVISLDEYDEGVTILLSSGRAIMLGDRLIESGQSVNEIIRVIRHYWNQDETISSLARDYLREFTFQCGQCSYRIHGVSTNACPECGTKFGIEELKRARTPINA